MRTIIIHVATGAALVLGASVVWRLAIPSDAVPAQPRADRGHGAVQPVRSAAMPTRPVHTFSIVARDPQTGEMGVAVQSHYFSVGPIVAWAEAGVGAVATQSLVEVSYGPKGLEQLRQGKTPSDVMHDLLKKDEQRDVRQVAMVDAKGQVAAWTGPKCIEAAGGESGEGFSVQANLMANDSVWPAMAKAFREANGDLAERMLVALEAGQKAGGDIRGQQSAAIVVVKGTSSGQPWRDRVFDVRVEDHARPIEELRRLVRLQRAYRFEDAGDEASAKSLTSADAGDEAAAKAHTEEAMKAYSEAAALAPEIPELLFWQAVSLFNVGKEAEALAIFKKVFKEDRNWAVLVPRLVPPGLLKADAAGVAKIVALAPPAPASKPSKGQPTRRPSRKR